MWPFRTVIKNSQWYTIDYLNTARNDLYAAIMCNAYHEYHNTLVQNATRI